MNKEEFLALDESTQIEVAFRTFRDVIDSEGYGRDYVYRESCVYVLIPDSGDSRPGCLIGQLLHRLGWSIGELHAWNSSGITVSNYVFPEITSKKLRYTFQIAQSIQDKKANWGLAYDIACETLSAYDYIFNQGRQSAIPVAV